MRENFSEHSFGTFEHWYIKKSDHTGQYGGRTRDIRVISTTL